jgi:inhibitor of KinA sporulation pathway (predicted exonuclease)
MRIPNRHYLIIDLEATCSDTGEVPRGEMEIIEIGAVVMDSKTFEIESEFQSFIRPVRHPVLTGFCTELTGIKQDQVVVAPAFTAIIAKMKHWMNQLKIHSSALGAITTGCSSCRIADTTRLNIRLPKAT